MSSWSTTDVTAGMTISGTQAKVTSSGQQGVRGSLSLSAGQAYFEIKMAAVSSAFTAGLASSSFTLGNVLGNDNYGVAFYPTNMTCKLNGTTEFSNSSHSDVSEYIVGFAVDISNKKLWITSSEMQSVYGSSAWNNGTTANPSTGVGGIDISAISGALFPCFSSSNLNDDAYIRTTTSAFTFSVPSGFLAWDNVTSSSVTFTTKGASSSMSLDSSQLIATSGALSNGNQSIISNSALPSSKVYFEAQITGLGSQNGSWRFGICNSSYQVNYLWSVLGQNANSAAFRPYSLTIYVANTLESINRAYADAVNDFVGVAVDVPNKKIWFTSNAMQTAYGSGAWNNSATASPASGTGGYDISTLGTGPLYACFNCSFDANEVCDFNPGSSAFNFTVPTGFSAWTPSSIGVPGQPTGLTASNPASSTVSLSWTAPSSGGAVTGYDVRSSTDNVTWSPPTPVGNVTTITMQGLASGTLYYFQVAAYNGSGTGPWSSSASATTTAGAPGMVSGLHVSSETSYSETLGWNSVSGATGYVIQGSLDDVNWGEPGATVGSVTSTTIGSTSAPLHSSTPYYWRIAATNAGGQGPWSNYTVSASTTGTGAPGQVALPTTTPLSSTEIRVSWTSVSGATGYYVKYRPRYTSTWTISAEVTSGTSLVLTGLQESTEYIVSVYAANSSAPGLPSAPQSQMTLRDFLSNPGEDDGFWLRPLAAGADWITAGTQVTLMRNGSNPQPTAYVNTQASGWAPAWYHGKSTDATVTINDAAGGGSYSRSVKLPVGAVVEQPGDHNIGGTSDGTDYMAWSGWNCTIDGSVNNSVQNGSTISCSNLAVVDASGAFMEDATTGLPGGMNSAGVISDRDLSRIVQDPTWFPDHTLQLQCDGGQVNDNTSAMYWPLAQVDTSLTGYYNSNGLNQGFFIGIPKDAIMPSGLSQGGQALWKTLQVFGAMMYNVSQSGACNFFAYPDPTKSTYQANLAIAEQMNADASTIIGFCCILNNQTSHATRKGGTPAAFPQYTPPNGDLLPTSNANVSPSSAFGGWYQTSNYLSYSTTPSNTANPT